MLVSLGQLRGLVHLRVLDDAGGCKGARDGRLGDIKLQLLD
jgi:hypothetical protein